MPWIDIQGIDFSETRLVAAPCRTEGGKGPEVAVVLGGPNLVLGGGLSRDVHSPVIDTAREFQAEVVEKAVRKLSAIRRLPASGFQRGDCFRIRFQCLPYL